MRSTTTNHSTPSKRQRLSRRSTSDSSGVAIEIGAGSIQTRYVNGVNERPAWQTLTRCSAHSLVHFVDSLHIIQS